MSRKYCRAMTSWDTSAIEDAFVMAEQLDVIPSGVVLAMRDEIEKLVTKVEELEIALDDMEDECSCDY